MSRLLVLLPPSEGKASGGRRTGWEPAFGRFPELAAGRAKVAAGLRAPGFDAPAQLGVKGPYLEAAMAANAAVFGAPTLPALRRYTGVLYDALGYPSLPAALRRRFDTQVLIVSGLLGLVGGADPIPDYKAPFGATVPTVGRLAAFWRPRIAPVLTEAARGAVIWDLLPVAHAAATPASYGKARWRVRVQRDLRGVRTTVSHENKTVKGALARLVVSEQITDPVSLHGWEGPGGYRVAEIDQHPPGGWVNLVALG